MTPPRALAIGAAWLTTHPRFSSAQALAFARGARCGASGLRAFGSSALPPAAAAALGAARGPRSPVPSALFLARPPGIGGDRWCAGGQLRAMTTKAWKTAEKAAVIKEFARNKIKSSSSFKFRRAAGSFSLPCRAEASPLLCLTTAPIPCANVVRRFHPVADGQFVQGRVTKRHLAAAKTPKRKRQLRGTKRTHWAMALVLRKLNFGR